MKNIAYTAEIAWDCVKCTTVTKCWSRCIETDYTETDYIIEIEIPLQGVFSDEHAVTFSKSVGQELNSK